MARPKKYRGDKKLFQMHMTYDRWKFLTLLAIENQTTATGIVTAYLDWLRENRRPPIGIEKAKALPADLLETEFMQPDSPD